MATIAEALELARSHTASGDPNAAAEVYRTILQADPECAAALHELGKIVAYEQRLEEAADLMRRAVACDPTQWVYYFDLGVVYRALRHTQQAIACFQRCVELQPEDAREYYHLGGLLAAQDRREEAAAYYREAIRLRPDYADAWAGLGDVMASLWKNDAALECLRRVVELRPDSEIDRERLAIAQANAGEYAQAEAYWREKLRQDGESPELLSWLAGVLRLQGNVEEAAAICRRLLQLQPDDWRLHSRYLYLLHNLPDISPREILAAHVEWDERHAARLRGVAQPRAAVPPSDMRPAPTPRKASSRLRLGFMSFDFAIHPVGTMLIRIAEALPQLGVEVCYYTDRVNVDEATRRFQAAATQWRTTKGLSDDQVCDLIRQDGVDVLFDLAGHTLLHRLLIFARRPAPVQITWLAYEGTTGLAAMDYLLTDRYVVPEGAESAYREKILRMPECYASYLSMRGLSEAGPVPALANGYVTFASFNNPSKISGPVFDAWAEILRRVPNARLLMKYRGLHDPGTQSRFRESMARQGVDPGRLDFAGNSPYGEFVRIAQGTDLALDSYPFHGGLTTLDCLWLGVPVVTCIGRTFASRRGLSYLSNVGLPELAADRLEHYVDTAVQLAADVPRLAQLRAGLRARLAASPLCDGPRLAAQLVALLRGIVH